MLLSFDSAIVRIRARDGKPLGAGFLVAPDLILTCWHVAEAALSAERLRLDFPTVAPGSLLTARLESKDEARDLAALRLETPAPAACRPVRLVTAAELWGHPCRAFGFPTGYDSGVWAEGKLLDVTGDEGWVQVSSRGDYPIQPGFSGAPLWDAELNGAVGMVVAADSPMRAAFCIPAARLLDFRPDLKPQSLTPNPYRGLLAFREQDAALFFGREAVSAEGWERVQKQPLTALVGPSGSGKSSVAMAGILPRARQMPDWAATSLRPGRDPFRELAAALIPLLEPNLSETDRLLEIPKLSAALERGDIPLADVLRRILERTGKMRLLVLLDQAEELYTLCEEARCRAFLDLWLQALAEPRPPMRLLLTLRADFLSQALLDRDFAEALQGAIYLLGPMRREELHAAIVEPARRHGVTFEDGLVERMLDEVGEAAGQLTLLEFALTQLWERQEAGRLTHAAYEAIGGVEGALTRYAEEVYEHEFSEAEREEVRRVFVQLVTPGEGTEDTRRRAVRAELGEARWALARRLADARLVVTGQDAEGQEYAEVAHEALIGRWGRLRGWMQSDRRFRLWQERLRLLARDWREKGRDEGALLRGAPLAEAQNWLAERGGEIEAALREYIQVSAEREAQARAARERTRRRLLQASLTAAFVFLLLAGAAFWQANVARQQRDAARARQWTAAGMDALDRLPPNQDSLIALALGVESMRLEPSLQADQLLRSGFILAPEVARMTHDGSVWAVAFSPDGGYVVSGSLDGTGRVWEAESGREVARMTHEGWVNAVAFSPDGRYVVSGSGDDTARVWEAATGREVARMTHDGNVTAVAFSPDGRYVVSGSDDNTARVWEAATGREVARMTHEVWVNAVAFSPDGRYVVSGSGGYDYIVRVWEAETGREVARMTHEGWVNAVAFSPDGRYVVSGSVDGTARVWEAQTGREVARMTHEGWVSAVAFSPDGRYVVSGSVDGTARVWEAETGREVARMTHEGLVIAVAFSPDGRYVVSGSVDGTARVWEAATGREIARMTHDGKVTAVAFSPDGRYVVSGSGDRTARVWEAETGHEVARMTHEDDVTAVAFSPDGRYVVSGSDDNTARVWEAATGREVARMIHEDDVVSVAFSPDGRYVVSGSLDGTARVWEAQTGREVARMTHEVWVNAVAFSPDGRSVVSGSNDNTARVWEAETGREVARMTHDGNVTAVAFSPDGRYVVSGSDDNTARVWEAATGREVARMRHEDSVQAVAFSPDGRYVVSGSEDGTARVWEAQSGREVARMTHEVWVNAVAFSPDGRSVVSGSNDNTARVWEAETGREVARMTHEGRVIAVAFSPDRRYVVSGSADGTARVWEAQTGREVARMTHDGRVTAVAFSPDGRYVVSGGDDGTIQILAFWRPSDLLAEACRRLPRNLTLAEWQQYIGEDVPYHATCPEKPIPEDTLQTLEMQRALRIQKWTFGAGEALLLALAILLGWQGWRRDRSARARWWSAAFVPGAAALLAGWQAWNAWRSFTPIVVDALGLALLLAVSAALTWPRAKEGRRWGRPLAGGLIVVLSAYAFSVYALGFVNEKIPPLPGAAWIWKAWDWLLPIEQLRHLPLSWPEFANLWAAWLLLALWLLLLGWAIVPLLELFWMAGRWLWRHMRRR